MCINIEDRTSQIKSIDVDILINRNLGCTTHAIITSIITNECRSRQYPSTLSSQLYSTDHISVDSIKIGQLYNVESVQVVSDFIRDKACPLVLDLITHRWSPEVLEAVYNLILRFSCILLITYDLAIDLVINDQVSVEDTAYLLLKMGPKVVVVQNKEGRRFAAIDDMDHPLKKECFWLPHHGGLSNSEAFSAAIAASLAYSHLPLVSTVLYCHLYSSVEDCLRSSFPRFLSLTFIQEAWSSVNDIFSRICRQPFINKMLDSSLDERIYDYYIVQDYLFFLDRGRMLKGLIDGCSDREAHRFLRRQLEKNDKYVSTLLSDNSLPPQNEKVTAKMPACSKYTKLMLTLASCHENRGWVKGLVALLPCTLIYSKVGDWMILSGMQPTVRRYSDFIDRYRDQARRDRLIYFLELTNRVVDDCTNNQRKELKQLFRQVCEYEHDFWDESYRYGMERLNQ